MVAQGVKRLAPIRLSKIDDDYLIDNTYPNRLSDMTLVVNRKIDVLLAGT